MNKQQTFINRLKPGLELPWWFTYEMAALNDDFDQRVVSLPDDAKWHSTQVDGVALRVLEYIPGAIPRLTGQIRLDPEHSPALLGDNPDLEILVQQGELESTMGVYPAGLYLRLPLTGDHHLQALTLRCSESDTGQPPTLSTTDETGSALLYVAAGQMLTSDTEQRRIDTNDASRWLPGPAEGTEVLPLHGHGSGNSMLIRWNSRVEIKPRLDPTGEEILVLSGTLQDALGRYPAGSWIRNPVEAWQNWGAVPGTVVYYKNGHFAPPDESQ
ncbi:cupin domain-containing protein [Granulosicoccus sp. 3-233]|uniref:cupin domain-containing protein n=1 Tax=Granulosicoccus sp. 3-233 TaxID=3417969 RepID=UPI003D3405DA